MSWFSPKKETVTPLCKNCTFAEPDSAVPKCRNPRSPNVKTSPVNGDLEWPYCSVERLEWPPRNCGISGRWFQGRAPAEQAASALRKSAVR